jgi:hypothetical protein
MSADDRIVRARSAVIGATDLLRAPAFDRASEITTQLEIAVAELEGLTRAGITPDAAPAVVKLCADLRLLSALHSNASRFYRGWARIAANSSVEYTYTGAETAPPVNTTSVLAQG